jgi:hypothetical protein
MLFPVQSSSPVVDLGANGVSLVVEEAGSFPFAAFQLPTGSTLVFACQKCSFKKDEAGSSFFGPVAAHWNFPCPCLQSIPNVFHVRYTNLQAAFPRCKDFPCAISDSRQ